MKEALYCHAWIFREVTRTVVAWVYLLRIDHREGSDTASASIGNYPVLRDVLRGEEWTLRLIAPETVDAAFLVMGCSTNALIS